MRFRIDEEKIYPPFLEVFLKSSIVIKYFQQCASGTSETMVKINKRVLENLEIVLFPISEQKKIAKFFMIWDQAIENTEKLIKAKEKQAQWLLARLLGSLQDFRGHVKDIAYEHSMRNRANHCATVLSVTNHSGFVLPEDQFKHRVASEDLSNYKMVYRGQYAYNPSRINVGSIARLDDWDQGTLSPMYVVFALDERKIDSDYFLHWLSSHEAKQRIRRSAQGSVRETVGFKELGAIRIPLPNLPKQKNIANILNTAKKEIKLLKELSNSYSKLKRGLMQKLLTGEWQIKSDPEVLDG